MKFKTWLLITPPIATPQCHCQHSNQISPDQFQIGLILIHTIIHPIPGSQSDVTSCLGCMQWLSLLVFAKMQKVACVSLKKGNNLLSLLNGKCWALNFSGLILEENFLQLRRLKNLMINRTGGLATKGRRDYWSRRNQDRAVCKIFIRYYPPSSADTYS